jgi:hypothetical protein
MKRFDTYTDAILPILLLLVVFTACNKTSTTDSLNEYIQLSIKAYESKNYSKYLRLILKIVDLEIQNYKYYYNLACAYALNGDL